MDIGGFNQSEAHISLHSRLALHNKTNIKYSPLSTKRKALGARVIKFLIPLFIKNMRVINWFPCTHLGIVNTQCFALGILFFLTNIEYLLIIEN